MSLSTVEKEFNISHPTICEILKNVPRYSKAKLNNPELNERFFNILNKDSAYYLGLIIVLIYQK